MMNVLYEDNHLLVVEKPANVPVCEDDSRDDDLLSMGKRYIKEKYDKPGNVWLGLVHRLDRPVGGVVVFARTSKAASRLAESVRTHQLGKEYYEPYEDRIAAVTELDGKPVYSRRSPKFAKMKQAFIDAGLGRYLEYSHGRMTFCFGRKLGKDGPFDRQYEKGDARFCYYRNRIWDK